MLNVLLNTDSLLTSQRTGIPHYTGHLLNGMLQHQDISSLYAFTGNRFIKYRRGQRVEKLSRIDSLALLLERKIPKLKNWISHFSHKTFESFVKKKVVKDIIYHEPNFIVKPFDGLCITTLHDLTCLRFPDLQPSERVAWFEKDLKNTLNQVNHIISVSEFTRQEAIRYLGISPDRITTVHNGVSKEFRAREKNETQKILQKYQLDHKKYILSVSTLEPRKNLHNLLKGYLNLPAKLRRQYPLILAGSVGWKIQELINEIKTNAYNDVKLLGYVPQADLPFIFSGAKAFCYLSTYEGFGLPVLEALASAVPVLTSENSAMAEFSKDQALLVNPLDVNAISAKFEQLIVNDSLEDQASILSEHYRENFSWKKCVEKTMEVFKGQYQMY